MEGTETMQLFGLLMAAGTLLASGLATAETPTLRIALLKFGTVNWVMDTVKRNGFDRAEGYSLETVGLANGAATAIAFQAGDADMMVTDWFWALRKRGDGKDLRFQPYSAALGAMMVRDARSICDLAGTKVGVVGGPFDKSWIVYQALARKRCAVDLAAETEAVFGAPPLMARQLDSGDVAGLSTFWHWAAKAEAAGHKRLIDVGGALAELGIEPAPALIGYVWDTARTDDALVSRFLRSVDAAKAKLASDDQAWEELRGRMKPKSEAEFAALRTRFREGITGPWTDVDTEAAQGLHALLSQDAPQDFRETLGQFDKAVFVAPAGYGG